MESLILPKLPQNTQAGKGASVYRKLLEGAAEYSKPHQFVQAMMAAYEGLSEKPDRSVHGRFFELVIGETLARQGIACLYHQAEIRHVPLAIFDWFLYHDTAPVTVSCKTKARDRWKQAAYEAVALKRVYPQAVNYLVTIEEVGSTEIKQKLAPQTIDHYVIASSPEYDDVIDEIASKVYHKAIPASPIIKGHFLDVGGKQ